MITRLSLKNFQCWKDLSLEIAPFTAIVGPSGYGKSALMRAITSLFENPAGTADITRGATVSEITLVVDGQEIVKRKSQSENSYSLGDRVFPKVGRDIPEEIAQVLNLPTLLVDGESLSPHTATQFDPPFLVYDNPGRIARTLATATGVDDLVEAQKRASADILATSRKRSTIQQQIEDIEADSSIARHMSGLRLWAQIRDDVREYQKAKRILDLIDSTEWKQTRVSLPDTSKLERALRVFSDLNQGAERLRGAVEEVERCHTLRDRAVKELEKQLDEVCPLCGRSGPR